MSTHKEGSNPRLLRRETSALPQDQKFSFIEFNWSQIIVGNESFLGTFQYRRNSKLTKLDSILENFQLMQLIKTGQLTRKFSINSEQLTGNGHVAFGLLNDFLFLLSGRSLSSLEAVEGLREIIVETFSLNKENKKTWLRSKYQNIESLLFIKLFQAKQFKDINLNNDSLKMFFLLFILLIILQK